MAHLETTNTHLQKILTHRNYMHHVNLQKQLNIFDRQKKLVERELLQITKVREAIQQINKGSSKNSPKIKKRGGSPKKLKNDSAMKSDEVVKEIKEGIGRKGEVENSEDRPSSGYEANPGMDRLFISVISTSNNGLLSVVKIFFRTC